MSLVLRNCVAAPLALPVTAVSLLVSSAISPTAVSLHAQEPERVSGAVSCEVCRITLDTIASIGGLYGQGLGVVSEHSVVAMDGRGRFLVSELRENEFSVFDVSGRFIRTVGRPGEGPGEYRLGITQIVVGPQLIHVFENHRGRTLLDDDWNVVQTHRFPGQVHPGHAYATDSEDIVMMANMPTPEGAGNSFHLLNRSGEMVSFGDNPYGAVGFYVTGEGESMWALQGLVNRVVRWRLGAEPQIVRTFDRTVEAFDRGPHDRRPGVASNGIRIDESGYLWLLWVTPDPEWTEPEVTAPQGREPPPQPPLQEMFENYLDVFDPRTGRTLARYRNDGMIKFVNGYGSSSARYVYAIEQNDAGVVYLHLMKAGLEVTLTGRPRRVLLPESISLHDATDTHVWGIRKDPLGVPHVVGRRLVPAR